jgi:hypothetical protein
VLIDPERDHAAALGKVHRRAGRSSGWILFALHLYRGAAKIMVEDLDGTPTAGLLVHSSRRNQHLGPHAAHGLLAGGLETQQRAETPERGAPLRGRLTGWVVTLRFLV